MIASTTFRTFEVVLSDSFFRLCSRQTEIEKQVVNLTI